MELRGERASLHRRKVGDSEQIGSAQGVGLDPHREVEADVEDELVEETTGQLGSAVVADSGALQQLVKCGRPFDAEAEVVAEIERLGSQ